ncbi:hypothetical protein ciss_10560 [Carboxydothermus islandicus]|uniref:Cell division protein ZapA n=1 Tax=Carboxydothermus islandicus TaxID=661089 RepID=A0A1L8D1V1_9THEO|nr:cell division protein ZapA [Carboxydothermus islandicus]GAV25123.1 hypothetical protein ciss_10560 [Carboxydothermus islandicus]
MKRIEVEIDGEKYYLKSDLPEEEVVELARNLNERIRELKERYPKLPWHWNYVLVGLTLEKELKDLKQKYDQLASALNEESRDKE